MPNPPIAANVFPGVKEYAVISRESTPGGTLESGSLYLPTTLQADKYEPDEKPTFLDDKSLVGSMTDAGNVIAGTAISDFGFSGPVFMDQMPHLLYNIMGDYTATGAAGTGSTTLGAAVAAGATTATVAAITGFSSGQAVQIGTVHPEIVVLSAAPSGTTITFTGTPARFAHANADPVTGVVAPFVHVFSLYNGTNGQPVTHNLDFYSGIPATTGARRYSYYCMSGLDFSLNPEQLFTQTTKGTSMLSNVAAATPVQQLTSVLAQPGWRTKVGIGGPVSTNQITDVMTPDITIARAIKPYFTADGSQSPFAIVRDSLNITGKFSRFAQDESPMLNMLNNTQQQLQLIISNGLTGAALLQAQFDMQVAQYDSTKLT